MIPCEHTSPLELAFVADGYSSADRALWCPTCGALKTSDADWRLPAQSPEDQKRLLGSMLGGALRTAFPGAVAKVEKFAREATVLSETIQWVDVKERMPEAGRRVLLRSDAPEDLAICVGIWSNWARAFILDSGDDATGVTYWAELPSGPRKESDAEQEETP